MMKILWLLMKRPSNIQIRSIKALFWITLVLTGIVAFNLNWLLLEESIFGIALAENERLVMQYLIIALWIPLIILWGLDISLLSRGRTRILQIVFWVLLIIVGGIFQNTPTLSIDILYPLFGLLAIIAGISGKIITTKGLKYGQKITKIRV